MSEGEIERLVAAQIGALTAVAALAKTRVRYVKAHGALANLAADNRGVANAIAKATRAASPDLALLAISGTELEPAGRDAGLNVFSEIFADRAYLSNGRLAPRTRPDAMIRDRDAAAGRLIGYLETGLMPTVDGPPIKLSGQSICVHGDSPGAVAMAQTVRARLSAYGVAFQPFMSAP
jgi:UPF0271 protein